MRRLDDLNESSSKREREVEFRLRIAIANGNIEAVREAVAAGADLKKPDSQGDYPVHWLSVDAFDPEIIDLLVEAGTDLDAQDRAGNTALHLASPVPKNKGLIIVQALLEAGADPNVRNSLGQTPLLAAVDAAVSGVAVALLNHGADPNAKEEASPERSPLMLAAKDDDKAIISALVAAGADLDVRDDYGRTALHQAVIWNSVEAIRQLLQFGADPWVTDKNGHTPLEAANLLSSQAEVKKILSGAMRDKMTSGDDLPMLESAVSGREKLNADFLRAADFRDEDEARRCLEAGVDVNVRNSKKETALCLASRGGHEKIVKMLIEAGADVNVRDKYKRTPLILASRAMWDLDDIARMLIDAGADVNAQDSDGKTAIYEAFGQEDDGGYDGYANIKVINILIKAGIDLDRRDERGQTALYKACDYDNATVVKILLDAGADVLIPSNDGKFPFDEVKSPRVNSLLQPFMREKIASSDDLPMLESENDNRKDLLRNLIEAINDQDFEEISALIAKGADINGETNLGNTPLSAAAAVGDAKIIRFLVKAGADINPVIKNKSLITPKSASLFIGAGSSAPIYSATSHGKGAAIRVLVELGADPDQQVDGETPLHVAAFLGKLVSVRALIRAGADVNIKNDRGETPLYVACGSFDTERVIEALLAAGADPWIPADNGKLPEEVAHKSKIKAIVKKAMLDKMSSDDLPVLESFLKSDHKTAEAELFRCVRSGDIEGVKQCLEAGVDVNARDLTQNVPLVLAVEKSRDQIVRALIEAGADVNARCFYGRIALVWAVRKSSFDIVKMLLDAGADPNIQDMKGKTPIFDTLALSDKRIFRALIEAGADVNSRDNKGQTVLHTAALLRGHLKFVELLIEAGADPWLTDDAGQTPAEMAKNLEVKSFLQRAMSEKIASGDDLPMLESAKSQDTLDHELFSAANYGNLEAAKRYLKRGANPNFKDRDYTPLYLAAAGGHAGIVRALLAAGADVNGKSSNNSTALHTASANGYIKIARMLVDAGADLDVREDKGITALKYAAANEHKDIVRLLIDAGADVNLPDSAGWTALHTASFNNFELIVEMLIDAGADLLVKNDNGKIPVDLAGSEKMRLLLQQALSHQMHNELPMLESAGKPLSASKFLMSAQYGNASQVEKYIADGGDVDFKSEEAGKTALHLACNNGHDKVAKMLIDAGADVNMKNKHGWTPLHFAAFRDYEKVVKLLLERGADPKAVDGSGYSVLERALEWAGNADIVRLLLAAGVDPNTVSKSTGEPMVFLADKSNHAACLAMLDAGANIDAQDKNGDTLLILATRAGLDESVKRFLDRGADMSVKNNDGLTVLDLDVSERTGTILNKYLLKRMEDGDLPFLESNLGAV